VIASNKANMVIINFLAEELKIDRFLIAKVTFRNTHWKNNLRCNTPYGLIENSCKLERTLNIFLSLKIPEKSKPIVVINPGNEDQILIDNNTEDICIKLTPDCVVVKTMFSSKEVETPWMITGFPEFINYKTAIPRDGGFNSFKFTVSDTFIGPARDYIKFNCNKKERKILVELK
jgi:hypothetical protein